MQLIIQRVDRAAVYESGALVGKIGKGILILLGVFGYDTKADAEILAKKAANLRIFCDDDGKMNLSLLDRNYSALVVSNFTLCADTRKGNRPSFINAMEPQAANELYEYFIERLKSEGVAQVEHGVFGGDMTIDAKCNGPITITLDSLTYKKPRNAN